MESRPARGVWVETIGQNLFYWYLESRPARGVWVET